MPTEKRTRKRAQREAKMAELERQRKRRASVRRFVTIVVIAGIAIGIYFAVSSGNKKKPSSATKNTTSTTLSSSTSTTAVGDTQSAIDTVAQKAGCPSSTKTSVQSATKQWSQPPAMTIDTTKNYIATVETDVGNFTITLMPSDSATGVNNFVFLAEHQFYNCVIFHRVIPGFVVQGGDPTGTGTGGPGYQFTASGPPTASNASQQYPLWSVAMANSSSGSTNPSTNGSQFFIVTGTQGESLPPDYVLIGQVTSGTSVVQEISNDGTSSGVPPKITHRMLTVTVTPAP